MWLAEATTAGQLVRLQDGRDRLAMAEHLLSIRSQTVIGLDFSFSFPAWFLEQLNVRNAMELWVLVAELGEAWLHACDPPFWGRPGRARPLFGGPAYRRTEFAAPRTRGIGPKSVFQVGGPGAVGTGSIRGMPLLHRLHSAGATIWPFARQAWPTVVEIYPRLLTGAVTKSDPAARRKRLEMQYPNLDPEHVAAAVLSEDAFDAAVSALVMVQHLDDLRSLPDELDEQLRLEGRIWHPAWRDDRP